MKIVIVEDEQHSARMLEGMIRHLRKDWEILHVIDSVKYAISWFENNERPDLIFMDIQLTDGISFSILDKVNIQSMIIFTTAYDQFALKAFDYNAVDYLLKPFSKDRLLAAIDKVIERGLNKETSSEKLDKISELRMEEHLDRVVVKDRHKINIIPSEKIRYIESMDDYVLIYTQEARFMKQKTMKFFEANLDPRNFIRIHRSYIVQVDNIAEIQQYEKESYVVILKDKSKLKVSKTGYKKLKEVLHF